FSGSDMNCVSSHESTGTEERWIAHRLSEQNDPNDVSLPPNVVRNAEGKLNPAKGYQWLNPDDPKDFRVKPKPGLIESKPGTLHPANGYQWVDSNDSTDFRVQPKPGLVESEPGVLRPATGYRWISPNDPNDFR